MYDLQIDNCSDLRDSYVYAGQRQHARCTFTSHSLEFMQNMVNESELPFILGVIRHRQHVNISL